ncbi:hypothetical protein QLQ12_43925 [Actinoplanes sp. NEAU-A12]|uniref:Uncharacterized protein n=1 Tax=Actinoplanes sandaracinus TaxID=3045177 RepID=A0ABT6X0M0_9ACTN|nr:hypothetical protein [Actinoplanes sandaracinus]MDI6105553.1 hypothetical protein [Actinoplanes sandaracinus]
MPLRTERRPGERFGFLRQIAILSPEELDLCRRSPDALGRLYAFQLVPDDDRVELSWVAVALPRLAPTRELRDAFSLVLESPYRTGAPGIIHFDRVGEDRPYALLPDAVAACAEVLRDTDIDAMIAEIPAVTRSMSALGGPGEEGVRWVITTVLDVVAEAAARGAALASWRSSDDTAILPRADRAD